MKDLFTNFRIGGLRIFTLAILSIIAFSCNDDDENIVINETSFQGKTFLVISGDITNEQAVAQMTEEYGPNTQVVNVLSTTSLTNLDLSMVENLVELRIESNEDLETVDISNLQTVDDELSILDNPLQNVDLTSLVRTNSIIFSENDLVSIDLSNLTRASFVSINEPLLTGLELGITNNSTIQFIDAAITNLDFSSLTDASNLDLSISYPEVESIDFSNLTSIGELTIGSTQVTSIDLNQLVTLGALSLFSNSDLTDLNISNLTSITDFFSLNNNALTTIDLSNISSIGGNLFVFNEDDLTQFLAGDLISVDRIEFSSNDELAQIDLSSLQTVTGNFRVGFNNVLTDLDISSLQTVEESFDLTDLAEGLNTLDLGALQSTGGVFRVRFNSHIETLNLNSLVSVELFEVSSNNSLTTLNAPNLTTTGPMSLRFNRLSSINLDSWTAIDDNNDNVEITFSSNELDSDTQNYLLSLMANFSPALTNSTIVLSQFNGQGPTGQGITDQAALEANGNTIQ